jgi:hypothetical protein
MSDDDDQLDLLAELHEPAHPLTKARGDDPASARRAAFAAFPRVGRQRHRILVAIAEAKDGLTYDGASSRTGIAGVSVSTRISELASGGWIRPDGERQTRLYGVAQVWVATEKAKKALGL